jgi:hypothetical protein
MAKSKSIMPVSGKIGEVVYVDGKDGAIARKAPKPHRKKEQPAFDQQSSRTAYLNKLAGELNRIIDAYSGKLKQSDFYRALQKRFRKEPLDNRFLLLKQLEKMEVNERYQLTKLGGAQLTVTDSRTKIIVTLTADYHPAASLGKHKVNCYAYEVSLLCWEEGSGTLLPTRQYGAWISLKDELPEFDFEFKRPAKTREWLVCLRLQVGFNEEPIDVFSAEGMQLVLAGSFEKKDLALWEKKQEEKMREEESVDTKKKENVKRVKPKAKSKK